jgi:hypothetical protein
MPMPTAIGHLINHAQLTRIIAATAAAALGLNINVRSKQVGMVVLASRLVAFPLAVADSGARAAHDRAVAGKYYCGGPFVGRRDPAAREDATPCHVLAIWV